jgi:hypothetical protein
MAQHNKICQICQELGHSKFYCRKKPFTLIAKISKKRLENPKPKKAPKAIAKVGKKGKEWIATSKEWKKQNPPDYQGYWYCKIGGAALTDGKHDTAGGLQLNLCHDVSRARDSTLANDLNNIFPGCQAHNKDQGSRTYNEYMATNPVVRCGNF